MSQRPQSALVQRAWCPPLRYHSAAYEHNLHVLDRTLGRLARDQLPQRRQPYDGRVRFTTEAVFEAVGIGGVARGTAGGGGDAGASGKQTGQK
eukprot:8605-Eustigmatos_ZCMA.PRE.1